MDDGARVSVVSIAWIGDEGQVVAHAWPFAQRWDLPAQTSLMDDADRAINLDKDEWDALCSWLAGRKRLVAQNAKFDCHMVHAGTIRGWPGPDLIDNVYWDTMIAQKDLDPKESTSLKPTAERLGLEDGGERDAEAEVKKALRKHKRYDLVPWEILGPYATKDAVLTILLWDLQQDRYAQGEGDRARLEHEMAVSRVTYRMEQRGMRFDVAGALDAADLLEDKMQEIRKRLPFETQLPRAKKFFFEKQGVIPYDRTETGQPKMDDQILEKMVRDRVPWAREYREFRKLEHARSAWYKAYADMCGADGRLRTSFRLTKVVSGRFSVERVNLQAIPHDYRLPEGVPAVRSLFLPAEGKGLWELDLSQAELRVAARYARCDKMLRLIRDGADVHGQTARDLFGVTPESADWFQHRQVAKRANFSFVFGVGADTFKRDLAKQTGIELSRSESEGIVAKWRSLYPEFGRAIRQAERKAQTVGWVRLAGGARRWFAPFEDLHKAFNQAVQGSIAEIVKRWMVEIEQEWPDTLVLQVHDSIVLEVDADREEEIVTSVVKHGNDLATGMVDVPMEVEAKRWR